MRRENHELRWEDETKKGSNELLHKPEKPEPYPSKYDRVGFIPFQVGLYADVVPVPDPKALSAPQISAPKKQHIRESLETFLTPGEYEAVPFSIYALKHLKNLRYDVTPLRKKDGTVLKGWAKPGYVEYIPYAIVPRQREGSRVKPRGTWHTIPLRVWELDELDYFDLRKGVPMRFWLTIRADRDCEPGTYRAWLIITSDSTKPLRMPLKVEVVPIQVPGTTELGKVAAYTCRPTISEFEYWNLHEHNFNTIHEFWNCGINAYLTPTQIDINYGVVDERMQFAKKMDFTYFIIEMANVRRILSRGYPDCIVAPTFKKYAEFYSIGCYLMRQHARENNWPELAFCPSDEPWGFYMWHMNEVIRRWMKKYDPATPVYGNLYGGGHLHIFKNFDIINTNALGRDPLMPYEAIQCGIKLWTYEAVREKFYPWAFDVHGAFKYRYNTGYQLIYHGQSDYQPELYFYRGEAIPRLSYERRREGLDGCRYAWYLEELLKEHPNPEIERKMLDLKYALKAEYFNRPGWRDKDFNPTKLDLGRRRLIKHIERFLNSWKGKDEKPVQTQHRWTARKTRA